MVLAVLSGSLFIFSSLNPASASICCTDLHAICDQWYDDCVEDCNVYQGIPVKYAICVNACESSRFNCYGFNCDITC
jgi:hypothetical protein